MSYKFTLYILLIFIPLSVCNASEKVNLTAPYSYVDCESSFRKAVTVDEFNNVIEECSSLEDANRFVTLSILNRNAIIKREKAEGKTRNTKKSPQRARIMPQQIDKNANEIELIEQRAMHNFTKNIEKFRQTLKAGAETNCGKIIEMKKSAVKVHYPLKNYGDEHWIDFDKVFPKGHGCRFVKGKYIAPATF
ncbi:MAG: hypothetical protein WC390_10660 [Sulfurimonas sp.]|jgi:hypothetical protein